MIDHRFLKKIKRDVTAGLPVRPTDGARVANCGTMLSHARGAVIAFAPLATLLGGHE